MDDPYIGPQQRAGYLKFLLIFFALAWFAPELWGLLLGFLYWFLVVGIPVIIVRWLIGKWFELNDPLRGDFVPTNDLRIFRELEEGE
jgi:hypothetical protein